VHLRDYSLTWTIKYSDTAIRELKKLDKGIAKEVLDYLDDEVAALEDPMTAGKALSGKLATYWRYRIRDMRVICYVDKGEVIVLVLRVGHRSEVYDHEKMIADKAAKDVASMQKTTEEEKKAAKKENKKDKA
jgi:mRNA interferase RelE/StbE